MSDNGGKIRRILGAVFTTFVFIYGISSVAFSEKVPETQLSVSIRCLKEQIKVGDPIPIEFTISNNGSSDYSYFDRQGDLSGRMDEYILEVRDASGNLLANPKYDRVRFGGGSTSRRIKPSESFQKIIDLNLWAFLNKGGSYQVKGKYTGDDGARHMTVRKPFPIESIPININLQESNSQNNQ